MAAGSVPMEEQRRRRLDGGVIEVEALGLRIDWQGKPAALSVMRDISARVTGRRARIESEQRLAALAENIPGATFQCLRRPDGRLVFPYVGHGVRDLFGVDADAVMARPATLLKRIHPEDRRCLREAIREADPALAPVRLELRLPGEGGAMRWVQSIARPREPVGGDIVWDGIFLDVTDRHEALAALRAAKEEAEIANRTKSEFLASMSHEIRTPLNAIMGFAEVIEKQMFGPVGEPRYQEYAADIHASGSHLLSLIEDILDLSKLEAGRMELREGKVDVARVIDSSLSLLKRRAEAGEIRLAVRIAKKLPALRGDERRIRQVLYNLLSNASKFTPDGGKVSVSASVGASSGLRIRVEDTGVGIRPEDIAIALTPFGQVHDRKAREDGGSGIGLPLAKSLVERHGGRLDLESEPGKGTRVIVRFPPMRLVA
jgi:PAS domain S-box-containing protein